MARPNDSVPTWVRKWGLVAGMVVLFFFMALVLLIGYRVVDLCGTGVGSGLLVLVLALGVGLAFAFIGGSAEVSGKIPGLSDVAVSLTGGVAAMAVMLMLGDRVFSESDCPDAGLTPPEAVARQLDRLKDRVNSTHLKLERVEGSDPELARVVRQEAQVSASQLLALPHQYLTRSQQIEQAYFTSQAHLLAGLAAYRLARLDPTAHALKKDFSNHGNESSGFARRGLTRIQRLEDAASRQPAVYMDALLFVKEHRYQDRLRYNIAAGEALRVISSATEGDLLRVTQLFDSIGSGFFDNLLRSQGWAPCKDSVIGDLCGTHSDVLGPHVCERSVCSF